MAKPATPERARDRTRRKRAALLGALVGSVLVWAPLVGLYVQREVTREISDRLIRAVPPLRRAAAGAPPGPRRTLAFRTTWAGWQDSARLHATLERANMRWYVQVRRADANGFALETSAWPARCLVTGNAQTGAVVKACGWRWQSLETHLGDATP